jgi:hypothetical protein
MIDPGRTSRSAEEGPGRSGILDRGLSVPWGSGGSLGERRSYYKRGGIPVPTKQKGRRTVIALRPFPLPPRVPARISNKVD